MCQHTEASLGTARKSLHALVAMIEECPKENEFQVAAIKDLAHVVYSVGEAVIEKLDELQRDQQM